MLIHSGVVWMASLLDRGQDGAIHSTWKKFVLKRMFVEKEKKGVLHSAERGEKKTIEEEEEEIPNNKNAEIFFGTKLRDQPGITRFVESFSTFHHSRPQFWLSFVYEGVSLSTLLYSVSSQAGSNDFVVLQANSYAQTLQKTGEIKTLFFNIANTLNNLHKHHVTHRDIKPENVLIRNVTDVTLCDFGSAVSADMKRDVLYPEGIDTGQEETVEYTPPEIRLGKGVARSQEVKYEEEEHSRIFL